MNDTNPHPRITADPAIMLGKPCIAGTRITVEAVLRLLAAGAAIERTLEAYPHIEREDVMAALAYAADLSAQAPTIAAE
ncbi:MAG: DUF433 domain-containing protein [Okeania sp. SIO3C4]|nr:DUF433 domain-containing protein [Okeania sp. SIO3C4]